MTGAQQRAVAAHQPGQDVFKSVLSEDINSKPFAAFPPLVRLAVIVGQPSEAGPYTIRVRVSHSQVTAIGPLGLEYVSANDDPRNHLKRLFPTQ